ncbi:MAG: pseudouridine synthase [Eubacteriales bacterium]
MEKIRLQKYLSECGVMSRRAAETEISAGHVSVNGLPAALGTKVAPDTDEVVWNGRRILLPDGEKRRFTYLLLNKPAGYVTTLSDEKGRPTVADLLSGVGVRLYPVGRLDQYSDGLLLCTNDGELTNKITHPSHNLSKTYVGVIPSHLDDRAIEELGQPFVLDGYRLRPFEVRCLSYQKVGAADGTVVEFTLHEGRNREIRKICAHHGYRLARLTRVALGDIRLGDLPVGKWRPLTDEELSYLQSF